MNVIEFRRPESRRQTTPSPRRRSLVEFASAMALLGVAFFLLPTLWSGAPPHLLAVIHLLVAVVYVQQGPRIAAGVWIALTLAVLFLTGSPSPVTYAIGRAAIALDQGLR